MTFHRLDKNTQYNPACMDSRLVCIFTSVFQIVATEYKL